MIMFGKTYEKLEEEDEIIYKPTKALEEMDGKYAVKFLNEVSEDARKYLECLGKKAKKERKDLYGKAQKRLEEALYESGKKETRKPKSFKIKVKSNEEVSVLQGIRSDILEKGYKMGNGEVLAYVLGAGAAGGAGLTIPIYVASGGSEYSILGVFGAFAFAGGLALVDRKEKRTGKRLEALNNIKIEV